MRVADGEMCAIPAWKYVVLDAATAPEVDGPITPTTLAVRDELLRGGLGRCGALLDGRVEATSVTFRPSAGAIRLTASFAQDSCSVPRKPAPPVIGDTKPIFSGPGS